MTSARNALRRGLGLIVFAALGAHSAAAAQSAVVLRVEPAADPLCRGVESALQDMQLIPDPGYYEEAQSRGLDPGSPAALDQLIPLLDVDLVLVPLSATANAMLLEYRAGRTGQSLGQVQVPLNNGTLARRGARVIQREARTRLERSGTAAQSPELDEGGGMETAGEEPRDDEADESPAGEDGEVKLLLGLAAGVGFAMRSAEWPTVGPRATVSTGAFPAFELRAEPALALSAATHLGLTLSYLSSIGAKVDEPHTAGATDTLGIRVHRFEAGFGPEFRFADTRQWRLRIAVGYGARNMRPDIHHLRTPSYTLAGPFLHVRLRIPIIADAVALQLIPEVDYLLQVGEELQDRGVEGSGTSFGAEARLEIQVADGYSMELGFRERHASLGSSWGGSASDVERSATARLRGEL